MTKECVLLHFRRHSVILLSALLFRDAAAGVNEKESSRLHVLHWLRSLITSWLPTVASYPLDHNFSSRRNMFLI